MNTLELETYMKADSLISSYYGGVVPKDLLPLQTVKPSFYVVNLDTSDKAGSHWIVMFHRDDKMTEYFDPLGKKPDEEFVSYLTLQSQHYIFNNRRCQSRVSNLCGQYCLFYCYFRSRGYSMQDILGMFDENNLLYNDQLVYFFYQYTK